MSSAQVLELSEFDDPVVPSRGLTVSQYAEAKRLPEDFLRKEFLLNDANNEIGMPYLNESGELFRTKLRPSMDKHAHKMTWTGERGAGTIPYGIWRVKTPKELMVVEGESDTHTLAYHDIPAVGISGAQGWKAEFADLSCFANAATIYVVQEPDEGGSTFVSKIASSSLRDKLKIVTLPAKDVSDLYLANTSDFITILKDAVSKATSPNATQKTASATFQAGGRNSSLTTEAGRLWRAGITPAGLEAELLRKNSDLCVPPLPKDEVLAIVKSISNYKREGATSVSSAAKQIVVEYASGTKTRRYQWLWPARLPLGKLALFVGNPDNGKSLTTVEVAAIVSTGRQWPDCPNRLPASKVLMLVGEDDIEDTTVPRLQAAGADLDNILFLKSVILSEGLKNTQTEREVQLDADLMEIKRVLSEHPEIRLITIDPISNYLGRTKMVAEQEVRAILIPLKNLAAEMNVCVLGVMHLNKKIDLGAINRIGGAMAFVGVARAVWLFAREDENPDQLYMLRVKNNNAKRNGGLIYQIEARPVQVEGSDDWMPAVKWIGEIDKSADDVLIKRTPGRPAEQRDEAAAWLMDFLKGGPQLRTKVEEHGKETNGFSLRTLERAKERIGARAIKKGKHWYWTLEADLEEPIM
jgi:hypothetical protein